MSRVHAALASPNLAWLAERERLRDALVGAVAANYSDDVDHPRPHEVYDALTALQAHEAKRPSHVKSTDISCDTHGKTGGRRGE